MEEWIEVIRRYKSDEGLAGPGQNEIERGFKTIERAGIERGSPSRRGEDGMGPGGNTLLLVASWTDCSEAWEGGAIMESRSRSA